MISDTSKLAYWEINQGQTDLLKQVIFDFLRSHAPSSRREIHKFTGIGLESVCGRVNEMLNSKPPILIECEKRKCSVTGRLITPVTVGRNGETTELFI